MAVTITLEVPDTLAIALGGAGADLARRILEAATAQQFCEGNITHAQVAEILGLSRWETDAFLKAREAFHPVDVADFANDLAVFTNKADGLPVIRVQSGVITSQIVKDIEGQTP
jgi:hypothetical protein